MARAGAAAVRACAGRPRAERRVRVIPMMNKAQTDIAYGFTSVRRSDPGYYAYWLMNNILGQYAIGGRLGDSIRERQGMAYYVFSALDANVIPGPLTIRAGVSPANVERAVASIDEELATLARGGSDATPRCTESKQYLIGSMPRTLETNLGIATFLQTEEFFGLGLDYDLRVPELLQAVTRDDVHEAARRTLVPSNATVVIAGPYCRPAALGAAIDPAQTAMTPAPVKAVFFDVDFTLIYPGPTFQGEGYRASAPATASTSIRARFRGRGPRRVVDPQRRAGPHLRRRHLRAVHATHHRGDGRTGRTPRCLRAEIYAEWAACQHFFLYDDVTPALRELAAAASRSG